jgi:hypothetical protein
MSMYDELRTRQTMPDGFQTGDWYQTKSLENCLVLYEIGDDGQLYEIGMGEELDPEGPQPLDYTGEVIFYNAGQDYRAIFLNGKLQQLELGKTWGNRLAARSPSL